MTRIELHEDGAWKDITGQASGVEIRWGRISEHGPIQPRTAHVTLGNSSSLFATDLAAWKGAHRVESMLAVKVEVPDGPWQRLKARLKRVRGLGWLPVRMRWETRFRGVVEPFGWVKP